jgi:hypothetical protein
MPIEINLECPSCGTTNTWLYREEDDTLHRGLLGCPGPQCTVPFVLEAEEVSLERANEIAEEQSTWDLY